MSHEDYICEHCGGKFRDTWTSEEREAEAHKLFSGEMLDEGTVLLCDDCFRMIMAALADDGASEAEAYRLAMEERR